MIPKPFYSAPWAFDGKPVMLHYFNSEKEARDFAAANQIREILETTPREIWRVMVRDEPQTVK